MKQYVISFIVFSFILMNYGCLDEVSESPLEVPNDVDPPQGITAEVGDKSVFLRWNRVFEASKYRLYRSTQTSSIRQIVETADTFYIDSGVRNESEYFYSISSVNKDGFEGEKSETVIAIPTVYSIIINNGNDYTNSRIVSVGLSAPQTTTHMMLGNNSDLDKGIWENARLTRDWELTGGDGVKSVYAIFRDEMGSESPVVCDSIILDTYAGITGVSVSPLILQPGSGLHISLEVEDHETGGNAWVEIEDYSTEIYLYNNGKGGDQTAGDNIFESDYNFPVSFRGKNLSITGFYTDGANNSADPLESADKITFTDMPEPVGYFGVKDSTVEQITIEWEESNNENFQYYRIYRDTILGVEENPAKLIIQLNNRAQSSYPDGDLREGETYYYRIYVVNDLDETAGSNVLRASTFDAIPDPVTLDTLSSIGQDRLTLTWSINQNTDFREYIIFRATEPGVTVSSDSIHCEINREITFYDDEGIDTSTNVYYYRVYVKDKSGKLSRSNEVSSAE